MAGDGRRKYATTSDRPDSRTPVQIDADVYDAMREVARAEERTMRGQIAFALREWLAQREAK